MMKSKLSARGSTHAERSPVRGTVMRGAERQEILEVVPTSVGLCIQVMHVNEHGMPTAGHRATSGVSAQNPSADRRRNGLRRPVRVGRLLDAPNTHVGRFLHNV